MRGWAVIIAFPARTYERLRLQYVDIGPLPWNFDNELPERPLLPRPFGILKEDGLGSNLEGLGQHLDVHDGPALKQRAYLVELGACGALELGLLELFAPAIEHVEQLIPFLLKPLQRSN